MSLLLPPRNHPARGMFDVSHLAEVGNPSVRSRLQTMTAAATAARAMILESGGLIRSVAAFVLNDAGQLVLVSHDINGRAEVLWNFEAEAVAA